LTVSEFALGMQSLSVFLPEMVEVAICENTFLKSSGLASEPIVRKRD